MTKRRKSTTFIAAFVAIIAACCFGFALAPKASAVEYELTGVNIPSTATFGSEFELPAAKITSGGQEYDAVGVIKFPGGVAYSRPSVTLDEEGVYEVEYRATVGNNIVRVRKSLSVRKDLFSFKKDTDTAEFKTGTFANGKDGVVVSMTANSELRYNRVIDVSKLTRTDRLLEGYVDYAPERGAEFYGLTVKLTDIYDENNVVTIIFDGRSSDTDINNRSYSDVRAGATGQTPSGWNRYEKYLYVGTRGSWVRTSFKDVDNLTSPIVVCYDAATKSIYGNNDMLIIDLDDPKYFSTLWGGFTTGEVRLSITPSQIADKTADFVITSIMGQDLSLASSVDEDAPVIEIDDLGYETAPDGMVGVPYPVYGATAFDAYCGSRPVDVRVYAAYDSDARNDVEVVNGKFTPTRAGYYTVVYTSSDAFGNVAEKKVRVRADASLAAPALTVEGSVNSGVCGTDIAIATPVYSVSSGKADLNVKVKLNGTVVAENVDSFFPEKAGTYSIEYVVTDYLGRTATASYNVTVEKGTAPVFIGAPVLPRYFLTGSEYMLPQFNAYTYSDAGRAEAATVIKITDADGEKTLSGRKYAAPAASDGQDVTVTYQSGETSVSYTVKAVKVKEGAVIDMSKYFAGANISASATSAGVRVTTSTDKAAASFVNALFGSRFSFGFTVGGTTANTKNKFGSLAITLTDSADPSVSVTLRVIKGVYGSGSSIVSVDGKRVSVPVSFYGDTGSKEFGFEYNNIEKTLTDNENFTVSILKTDDGKDFDGFKSNKIYLDVKFEDVTAESEINVTAINGQMLSDDTRDRVIPMIRVLGEADGNYAIGSTGKVFDAVYADVLDPNVTATVSVETPSGEYLVQNGVTYKDLPLGEYDVTLTEYGNYIVYYKAVDTSGRTAEATYGLYVADRVAPVISISGKTAETAKAGSSVAVPSATATDNCDGEVTVYVFVTNPDHKIVRVTGSSFTADKTGKWTITYYALDAYGNTATETRTVTVK